MNSGKTKTDRKNILAKYLAEEGGISDAIYGCWNALVSQYVLPTAEKDDPELALDLQRVYEVKPDQYRMYAPIPPTGGDCTEVYIVRVVDQDQDDTLEERFHTVTFSDFADWVLRTEGEDAVLDFMQESQLETIDTADSEHQQLIWRSFMMSPQNESDLCGYLHDCLPSWDRSKFTLLDEGEDAHLQRVEVLEYYAVSSWLATRLLSLGERTIEIAGYDVWLRCGSGQDFFMDDCWQEVACQMIRENLVGHGQSADRVILETMESSLSDFKARMEAAGEITRAFVGKADQTHRFVGEAAADSTNGLLSEHTAAYLLSIMGDAARTMSAKIAEIEQNITYWRAATNQMEGE